MIFTWAICILYMAISAIECLRYDLLSDQSFSNNALNSVLLSEADWDVQTSQTKSERELSCEQN